MAYPRDECYEALKKYANSDESVCDMFFFFAEDLEETKISNDDKKRIYKAVEWAAECHRNQKRKNKKQTPYIIHPIGVAGYLLYPGKCYDADILIGALLHDTVEDTDATLKDIEDRFGKTVADYVAEVTDNKSLPKAERKRLQVVNAPHKSKGAAQIKLADKIYNTKDLLYEPIPDWTPERIKEYFAWSRSVVEGLPEVNPELKNLFLDINNSFHSQQ